MWPPGEDDRKATAAAAPADPAVAKLASTITVARPAARRADFLLARWSEGCVFMAVMPKVRRESPRSPGAKRRNHDAAFRLAALVPAFFISWLQCEWFAPTPWEGVGGFLSPAWSRRTPPPPTGPDLAKVRALGRRRDVAQRTLAWFTLIVMFGVTASGLTPLVAVTVNVARPAVVGVPERTPLVAFRLSPAGRAPEDT